MPTASASHWSRPLLGSPRQRPTEVTNTATTLTTTTSTTSTTTTTATTTSTAPRIKVVLVGDGAVGKSSLIASYSTNGFLPNYEPTAYDNYNVVVSVDGQPINIQLCDTAGQDDFDHLRSLCYPETDVVLICFSIVNPMSYHRVSTKWIGEIHKHCLDTPIILVGTKSDLRSDIKTSLELGRYGQAPITATQGHQLAQRIGASSYVETSALTQQELKEAFDQAIVSALRARQSETKCLSRQKKPLSLWHKWFCCWKKS